MAGPIQGVKVIDLTRVLAGPWCTQLLGDLGAEVIKIENPEAGDDTRKWGPPWLKDQDGHEINDAAYFCATNRNKSSIALNLKTPEGVEIVKSLIARADVFVENFKVGGLAKLGLSYGQLKKTNPKLIYVSITGFGQTGPLANQPGYDYLIQGLGGLMSITGREEGAVGAGPQRVGVPIVDINAGFYATVAVLSALLHREKTTKGQYIDLALLDSQVGWLANQAMNYLIGGQVPARTGNNHPNLVPYQPFSTADGDIIIAVGNDRQFRFLCDFLGESWLADDARFLTNADRVTHRDEIEKLIAQEIAKQPSQYWLHKLPAAGVPCSIINNIEQVFDHPQVKSRGMQIELQHKTAGALAGVANPIKFSDSKIEYTKAPPTLGQDTQRILKDVLRYDEEKIQQLKARGIVS